MTSEVGRASEQAAAAVQDKLGYRVLVGVGLISYGVVHLLIGWTAVQLAWSGRGDASSQGALRQLAATPLGTVLLWVVTVGLFTLVLWQGIEAAIGHRDRSGGKRTRKRFGSAGKAVVYLVLGISAARIAAGGGSRSDQSEETLTSRLLAAPFGRYLVVAVGLAVLGVGVYLIVKGVRRRFAEDLDRSVSEGAQTLGVVGYAAKGLALIIIGVLFGWAAISYDPEKAAGLDGALKTVRDQPIGSVALTAMAVGIACFGLFCFVWARHAKHEAGGPTRPGA